MKNNLYENFFLPELFYILYVPLRGKVEKLHDFRWLNNNTHQSSFFVNISDVYKWRVGQSVNQDLLENAKIFNRALFHNLSAFISAFGF